MEKQVESADLPQEPWGVTDRWGDLSGTGFTALPNTLIKAQSKLGLTSNDLVVVLNVVMHWWRRDDLPFPRTNTISKRTGLSMRTIQRSMNNLQRKGYFRRKMVDGRTYLDPAGLREALEKHSEEHSWAFENMVRERPARNGATVGVQSDGRE